MALEIKLGQDLRLRQQLVMTPQLQQAIKILQLSLPELESIVQTELEQNPMLEPLDQSPAEAAGESEPDREMAESNGEPLPPETDGSTVADSDDDWETGAREEKITTPAVEVEARDAALEIKELNNLEKLDWREYLETYSNNWQESAPSDPDDDHRSALENTPIRRSSLEDHVMWQLRMSSLPEADQRIGATIIYNLNDDGYLETPLEELAAQLEVEPAEVEPVLKAVQRFDPPGVAARDLRECLIAQLQNLGMEESLAARIVKNHLDLLEKHRYGEIAKVLGVTIETVGQAAKIISELEPKPGRDYGGEQPTYVVPDVYIHKVGEEYVVTLNRDAVPRLRLAGYYQRVLNDVDVAAETREYLQERLRSARWLVKSIYQRQQTIFKVATSIVKFQRAFFDHGISVLRPLVLKDVAEDIGMHESTISRATANKYAHTPQGIYELKFFFTSGVKGAGGEDVSAETVKEHIRVLVGGERPNSPLSDQAIAEMLKARQINIARRTVAKYRQAMGILPSANRKQVG
ncbi:MAG: RNA polymerase factor sigma-54 [Candidatus Binatus sp.]|uniref:RNA polymerase factor sigma-54 n=1 Tax=Candidatus Binatus sp. TaxID=2811406 RepID=UPI00272296CA|nr:RNA polymerase factor sigma-54 [Candidatus Binatus sp.]MDO8432644.1 RNA polymerase factor sigma-54 [Candidatus Binatus sp.]